jgi:hypothetical protein
VESRLLGFPCFPYSVISMACFGNAFHKITITAKARFGNRNHLSEMATLRPCANVRVPPTASTSTLTVRRRETARLTVTALLKTACPRTKRFPGTASGPSYILR